MMNFSEYKKQLAEIPFGKKLPNALYVYMEQDCEFGNGIKALVQKAITTYNIDNRFNVIKFRLDELKISFLSYPEFLSDPHPELQCAITVDLVTGKFRYTDYKDNFNPPILHRKETFLRPNHPMFDMFRALTKAEEAAGLYADTRTIGFKLNWTHLLAEKKLTIKGHEVLSVTDQSIDSSAKVQPRNIERHKTALNRSDLSKPIKTLIEYGLMKKNTTLFDYGCGLGTDIQGLLALGYSAEGWDPVFRPDSEICTADVVNLGYVINVIEDPAERLETLCLAFNLAKQLLVVSALIKETVDTAKASRFRDGVVTQRNTFQKFYDQRELQQYIEDALEVTAIPIGLGIFYAFHDQALLQDFLSERTHRFIDWNKISAGLGFVKRRTSIMDSYESQKELLDSFWDTMLDLGRQPNEEEYPRLSELRQNFGTPKKAEKLFIARGGEELLKKAWQSRYDDLLVYLALSNLRKPIPFQKLSQHLQLDIRCFFGNYKHALELGRDLLFSAGKTSLIEQACQASAFGWQDEQALYIHRSILKKLPPLLQVYVGCASLLGGDSNEVDLIKLHKTSGKVTYLFYDDFEHQLLPELQRRIKINLRTLSVQVFDHSNSGQVLFYKDEFLLAEDPMAEPALAISGELRKLGINPKDSFKEPNLDILLALESLGIWNKEIC